ncbi:MAG: hypothetical protein CVU24_15235 [Betaproteobacteria bacterium HGW-Betaproteobacteria-18]|nr:MAG: hypothetical protein CVU73_11055 [Deltaproteobacteria bacterium HGW-Deltaproteobacteria-8]PKO59476.1 MAG: hypothetical protein CVU24_15235 [Betaproteobacteria bacterium HGW-Betaproteobacteria-18]
MEELRHENASYRTRAQEAKRAAEQATEAAAKANTEAEAKITAAQQAANERIIRAELKAAALKAGMVDLDGLKLADLSKVKLNQETGDVEGADELMAAMKEAKPYLFGSTQNSSTPGTPPPPKTPTAKKAQEMTPEEYKAERAKFK